MERIRIRSQTRRSKSAPPVHCPVSTADRLANLVRGDGFSRRLPVDVPFCLETFAQRSGYIVAPGQQSVSRQTAALHSCTIVSLPIRAAGRERLVAARTDHRMAARFIGR